MEKKFNINNVFYGVVGVGTLIVAIVGATYAYFMATRTTGQNEITGNMASIGLSVTVNKVSNVDDTVGLIPMSNNMIEQALTKNNLCVDDNGNAVCQVYRITVANSSSVSMFVDGYVTLSGGSGNPVDYPAAYMRTNNNGTTDDATDDYQEINAYNVTTNPTGVVKNVTTMRWAQAFCSTEQDGIVSGCTTSGGSTVRIDSGKTAISYAALGGTTTMSDGTNAAEIKINRADVVNAQGSAGEAVINGNGYEAINKNYIRLSNHTFGDYNYDRDNDTTSALVYNQYLQPNDNNVANNTGTSSSVYVDAQVYYIVVWLSENGFNQTANSGEPNVPVSNNEFFDGNVTFITSQGNEVTATFNGRSRVIPDTPIQ